MHTALINKSLSKSFYFFRLPHFLKKYFTIVLFVMWTQTSIFKLMLDRITLFILIPENIFNLSIHSWSWICTSSNLLPKLLFYVFFPITWSEENGSLKKSLFFIVYLLLHWLERTYWIIGLLNNHTQYSLPWKSYLCRYRQRLSGICFFFIDDFLKKIGIFFC